MTEHDESRRLEEMLEAAHQDPQFKRKLLANPKKVAEKWGVQLGEREEARLTKLGAFAELAQEVKRGRLYRVCDPKVCYPSTVWLRQEVADLIREIEALPDLQDWIDPIFYPPPPDFRRRFDWRRFDRGSRRFRR